MAEKKDHIKNYSAEDLHRYYQGAMSPAEMHALEKAALDDPFLADALEGYTLIATPVADSEALTKKLEERVSRGEKKRGLLYRMNFKVPLRVAAFVVLLAGFGYLVYQWRDHKNGELANTDKDVKAADSLQKESTVSSTAPAAREKVGSTESIANKKPPVSNKKIPKKGIEIKETKPAVALVKEGFNASVPSISAPAGDTFVLLKKETAAKDAAVLMQARRQEAAHVFKGRIVDEKNTAIPFASVMDKKNTQNVVTDNNGEFTLTAPDSTVDVLVNSVGFQPNVQKLKNNELNEITLHTSGQALNEVVVTGYGKKAKNNVKNNKRVTVENAVPDSGWVHFEQYVTVHLKTAEQLNTKPVNGEVKLTFIIDDKGEPEEIQVEHSLCKPCDDEAIRIIEKGPKWKILNQRKKVKATIRF